MKIELELWQLITLLIAFFGCIAGFAKLVMSQIDKRLETRFNALEEARQAGAASLREMLDGHARLAQKTASELSALERQFLEFKVELARDVVWRDDYVRGQTIIEAKLDALYSKFELVQFRGGRDGS